MDDKNLMENILPVSYTHLAWAKPCLKLRRLRWRNVSFAVRCKNKADVIRHCRIYIINIAQP